MTKEQSHVMLEPHNVRMGSSNERKKSKGTTKCKKKRSHVMLELHNVMMESPNVRKKSKRTAKCEKTIVTCDVGIAQYEDETIKCEE